MHKSPTLKQNITKFILVLLIFIGFLLALDPRVTGIAIHEWLTIAGAAAIVLHLLLSWNWIADFTRRFFRKFSGRVRLNYILNWLFFIDGVLVMLTGVMISEVVLLTLGIQAARNSLWRQLYTFTAYLSLFLLALHLALNWNWVINFISRNILKPIAILRPKKAAAVPETNEVQS
jgi:hypothetical protein